MYGLHNISHGESSLRTESQETAKIAASKLSGWIVEKFSVMISSLSVKSNSRGSFYSSPLAIGRNWTSPHTVSVVHSMHRHSQIIIWIIGLLNIALFLNMIRDWNEFHKNKIRVACNDSKLRIKSSFFQFHSAISSWDQRWSRISKI